METRLSLQKYFVFNLGKWKIVLLISVMIFKAIVQERSLSLVKKLIGFMKQTIISELQDQEQLDKQLKFLESLAEANKKQKKLQL